MTRCDSGEWLPMEEAIDRFLAQSPSPPSTEVIALTDALGREMAEDVFSPRDLPRWDNSTATGYALRALDVPEQGGYLHVVERLAAVDGKDGALQAGHAVPIVTGAPLPQGADTVVPQARCRVYGQRIWCPPLCRGEHVCKRGGALQRGQRVVSAGMRLRGLEIGLLAAAGIPRVKVYRRG
ncbi:hypothetical protein [Pseudomonas pergaminensis]|uniref:hypothetical protein n=1 Tax=Pseudomonas pergaminensis TaxID=2853159 RepID=UPI0034D61441